MRRDLGAHCDAKTVVLLALLLLPGCMSFQERSFHRFSGVVLNAETKRPLPGAVVVLDEMRAPLIVFPFSKASWKPIAHTTTASDGSFLFEVCMEPSSPRLRVDYGDRWKVGDAEVWSGTDNDVKVRFLVRPEVRVPLDDDIDDEDGSFTRDCMKGS